MFRRAEQAGIVLEGEWLKCFSIMLSGIPEAEGDMLVQRFAQVRAPRTKAENPCRS